jgi:NhaP-type Na+/H+ or K+/H+ antiporter
MSILFFISIALIFGFIGGKITQYVKLPGVVGYLIAGLIFGPSFLNVFHEEFVESMNIFASFTLSLVAFIIGSEMKLSSLKEMGKGIGTIIFLESFGAFLLVAAGVYFLTQKLYLAFIFGAIAPASAPAGTVAVLQEYKAKGRMTSALYAVVGLDDGLAIMIFAVAAALARMLIEGSKLSAESLLQGPILEIIGSIALGCAIGVIAGYFMRPLSSDDVILATSLGSLLMCTGIAIYFNLSLILANLSLGMIHVNLYPAGNRRAYRAIESVTLPVYIVFFFLAGAHLHISLLPSLGFLGLVYVLCRTGGLIGGAYLGGVISKQTPVIRRYLGLGILCQAGVAIGLSLLVASQFRSLGQAGKDLAVMVVNTVAASTIIFEIIGPIGTRIAITKAGEVGLNITEEDLIKTYKVGQVMKTDVPVIPAGTPLREVVRIVSNTDCSYYSVVDDKKRMVGAITLDGIRSTFASQELNDWLVALDIVEPIVVKVTPDVALSAAFELMEQHNIEYVPVVVSAQSDESAGVLDYRAARRQLSAEVLSRQQEADRMYGVRPK